MCNRGDGKPGEGEYPDSLEPPSAAALTGYNLFRTIRAHKLNKKPHTELKAAGRTSSYLYYITSVKRGTLLHLLVGHTSTQSHSCLASKRASSFLTPAKTNQEHTYFSLVSTPGVVFIQDFNKNLSRDVTSIAITKVKHQPNLSRARTRRPTLGSLTPTSPIAITNQAGLKASVQTMATDDNHPSQPVVSVPVIVITSESQMRTVTRTLPPTSETTGWGPPSHHQHDHHHHHRHHYHVYDDDHHVRRDRRGVGRRDRVDGEDRDAYPHPYTSLKLSIWSGGASGRGRTRWSVRGWGKGLGGGRLLRTVFVG
ncbi:hypothetical protein B0T09DRAFT_396992 [Sordaria sp. MPI-SDFR-AT-0083]|nr:hypothetical protein B0T09DRAFT_396992 [Sordaria sp. MPI-SDFR-AT-0083]